MIPFALMTADGRSTSLNAQRLINMFAEKTQPGAMAQVVLRSTPGLMTFGEMGTGPIRGVHVMQSVLYAVSGTSLYSVDSGGTGTLLGTAGTIAGTGFVSMSSNAAGELVISNSAGTGWIWNGSTLTQISSGDADFTDDATNFTFLDQYIVYGKKNTGKFYASDLNNATSYNALSFATAEARDDNVVWVYAFAGHIWVFGVNTVEVWYDAGSTPFPFERIQAAVYQGIGGVANTVADIDQNIFWLAPNGNIYRAAGLVPEVVSNPDISNRVKSWTNHYAFTYYEEGHSFYVLGADEGCICFDLSTGYWHERESFTLGRWRANSLASVYGKNIVGDAVVGRLYDMSLSNYADGDASLQRRIISPPLHRDGKYMSVPHLQVHFEAGVGLTSGQGSDPQVIMDWSNDGGKTWGNEHWGSIGKIGEYRKRAIWRRTGRFRERVYRLTYTDPTPFTIYGAAL